MLKLLAVLGVIAIGLECARVIRHLWIKELLKRVRSQGRVPNV